MKRLLRLMGSTRRKNLILSCCLVILTLICFSNLSAANPLDHWQSRNRLHPRPSDVAYGDGTFVIVGGDVILTSPDGVHWATQRISENYESLTLIRGITFGGGIFVAVGSGGTILQSDKVKIVKVLAPNGREPIPSGTLYPVSWGAPSRAEKFKLMLSTDSGLTWSKVAENLTEATYDWSVPVTNRKRCLLKVIGYESLGAKVGAGTSERPFPIQTVTLTSPNGREPFHAGDLVPIAWTINKTAKPITKVLLYYTKNAGSTWNLIDTLSRSYPPGDYTQGWTVPSVGTIAKTKCKVKVVLKDAKDVTRGSDTSDSYFTIAP